MPLQANVKQFVQNRETTSVQPNLTKRSLTPQPNSHRERTSHLRDDVGRNPRASSRDGRNNDTKRQDAVRLKLPVPNTINKRLSDPPLAAGHNVTEVTPTIAHNRSSRTVPHVQLPSEPLVSAFDDTQSIQFDDSTSKAEDEHGQTNMHFLSRQRRNSPDSPRASSIQNPYRIYEERPPVPFERPGPIASLGNWQVEVDDERRRQGERPIYGTRFDEGIAEYTNSGEGHDEGYEPDGDFAEVSRSWDNTPSRTRTGPEFEPIKALKKINVKPGIRRADYAEPLSPPLPTKKHHTDESGPRDAAGQPLHHNVNRFKIGKPPDGDNLDDPSKETQPPPNIPQPAFSSKVSSYHESSSEEDQPHRADTPNGTPALKRSHQDRDLDFDSGVLQTKTIADLDAIPFTVDPSAPPPQPAVDANGNPMTLFAKLTNLTKMRPEDQRQLFKSQTDEEREQTAVWFLEKFKSDMKKLMAVRLERRMIAMRYELEVKKREKRVQVKKADVDRELEGLRKGGVELIGGKAAAR